LVVACDESFDATAPSELAFSVFGYLDASADTQWIRVMPIRPLKVTEQDADGTTVTLEHLGTGRIFELRDSLFRFSPDSDTEGGSDGAYVHNFWTVEDIEPGAAYRFSAWLEGEDPVEAVVEIPRDYEVEVAINQFPGRWGIDELRINGVKHIPFLTTATQFYDDCDPIVNRVRYAARSADDGIHLMELTKPMVVTPDHCGALWVSNRTLWIVGSETVWPTAGDSPITLGESGLTSNVTNAVGFIGGVLTKEVPYEHCEVQSDGAQVPDYCLLRYDSETAAVSGTLSETRCGDGPIDSATVQLTELDREPARIRTVLTNRDGEFVIGALEPGIPHLLWMRAPQIPTDSVVDPWTFSYVYTEWGDIHTLHTDTLTFVPGQQVEFDIHLERLTQCNELPPAAR